MVEHIHIEPMMEGDIDPAVKLIELAMNAKEAVWAANTFRFYFQCISHDIDPARRYFCSWNRDLLCGLIGLHHYRWGPPENTWLSWFAVHPDYQDKGLGGKLIDEIEVRAVDSGFNKLFIETYNDKEFEKARRFYIKKGYVQAGEISDYLPNCSSMLVYKKDLTAID